MVRTHIQVPDALYEEAKRVARERELSLAEVVRRGLEYVVRAHPPLPADASSWQPPMPRRLGRFRAAVEDWRELSGRGELGG